jgi:hypothetical protein
VRYHYALHRHAPFQALRFIHIIPKGTAANRSLFTCIACTGGKNVDSCARVLPSSAFWGVFVCTGGKENDPRAHLGADLGLFVQ